MLIGGNMKKKLNAFICCLALLLFATVSLTACAQATIRPEAAAYQSPVSIERLTGVSDAEVTAIKRSAEETTHFFHDAGLQLQKPIQIILVRGRQAYMAEVMSRFKLSEIEAARAIQGTDAVAGPGRIIINMDGVPSDRQKTFLTAHETTHQYQRSLAGNRAVTVKWLLEGMADTVGAQVVERMGYMTVAQYRNNWQNGLRMSPRKPELAEMRDSGGWANALSHYGSPVTYKTAGLAVLVLTERFGQEKVLTYFKLLGQGDNAENAFYRSFGLNLADFETEIMGSIRKAS